MKLVICKIVCTFFGIGKSKWMPGTIGSVASFPIFYLLPQPLPGLVLTAILTVVGTYAISLYSNMQPWAKHDAKEIVIDEVCGQLFTLYLIALITNTQLLGKPCYQLLAFISFRFFDIAKPFPIGFIDARMRNSFGVMLDDLLASLMAALLSVAVIGSISSS